MLVPDLGRRRVLWREVDGDGAVVAQSPDSQTDAQMFVQLAMEKAYSVYTRLGSHSGPGQPAAGI